MKLFQSSQVFDLFGTNERHQPREGVSKASPLDPELGGLVRIES